MVLPLLFALGAQMLAGSAGAAVFGSTALAGGLAAAAGNVVGQGLQNGGFDDINWGSAALSGVGAGIGGMGGEAAAKAAQAGTQVAQTGAQVAGASGSISGIADAAAKAANAAPAASVTPWFDKMMNPDNLMKAGGDMAGKYMGNTTAMAAATMGGLTPPVPKGGGGRSYDKDAQEKQDMWNEATLRAMSHEKQNNGFRYGDRNIDEWFKSAGIGPNYGPPPVTPTNYREMGRGPSGFGGSASRDFNNLVGMQGSLPSMRQRKVTGFAEGGAVPTGIGLNAMVDDVQKQEQQKFAQEQTQEMFDIAILLVTGKLKGEEQSKAMQIMVDAMGEQQAMQYLQSVAESVKGQRGKVVAGRPSETDNVMAKDAQTGEPIKLATGEGILPTGMVQAAGGGLAGMKNIVSAASKNLPQIRQPAMRFMQEAHA